MTRAHYNFQFYNKVHQKLLGDLYNTLPANNCHLLKRKMIAIIYMRKHSDQIILLKGERKKRDKK